MLTKPNTRSGLKESEETVNKKRIYAAVPYIKGFKEHLNHTMSHLSTSLSILKTSTSSY